MEANWSEEDLALVVAIVWAMWTNRNEVRHGGLRKSGDQLLFWCKQYLDDYWVVLEASVKMQQQLESKWLPPDEPSYKINVAGAIFASKK